MPNASIKNDGPQQWAEHEFAAAELKDGRRSRRLQLIAADFARQPSASIPKACSGWAKTKAAYRFFAQPALKWEMLIEPHQQRTRERCLQEPLVLVVQDTTGLNYGERAGLGLIGRSEEGAKGLWLHSSMAFTAQGQALGLVRVEPWQRDPASLGKAAQRHERPTREKESQRWLNSFEACVDCAKASPATRWVNVADREADLYELFAAAALHPEVGVLVRARHNRKTEEEATLDEVLEKAPLGGKVTITVPRRPGVAARTALLEVRWAPVKIKAPRSGQGPNLMLWVVEARERGHTSSRIHWRLLTNLPIEELEGALEKIGWYRLRWQIEEYHRVLKSGCQTQSRQLETGTRLLNVLMVDMVVAWRVMSLSRAARESRREELEECFSSEEIEVIKIYRAKLSSKRIDELTIKEAVRTVAGMGGFLGRKGDGEPGAMTVWRGLENLAQIVQGWRMAKTYG